MAALTNFVSRHPRLVLIIALACTLAAAPLATKQQVRLRAGDTIATKAQSAVVTNAIATGKFIGATDAPLSIVLAPTPKARPGDMTTALEQVTNQAQSVSGITVSPHGEQEDLALSRTQPSLLILHLNYGSGTGIDQARTLMRALKIGNPSPGEAASGRVNVYLVGEGALWAALIQTAYNETITAQAQALPLTLIVLLLVFGSLVAALLPLAVGVVSVAVAGAIIYSLSFVTDMSIFASTISSMVGLGVAIDYSMFIVVRYREEIGRGLDTQPAIARTMSTSGRAIAYSGLTFAVSQMALFLIPSPGIRSIGEGSVIVVAVSVLTASTVLPVLLAKMGRYAYEPGVLARWMSRRRRLVKDGFWERWTGVVMSHPVICLVAASSVMLAIATPTFDLTVRNSAVDQLPSNNQVIIGGTLMSEQLGIGELAPLQVLVRGTPGHPLQQSAVTAVANAISKDPTVSTISRSAFLPADDEALITAQLNIDPESQQARNAIDRLRKKLPLIANSAAVSVGGATAVILDFDRLLSAQMWRPILFVLAVSFVVLFLLLRSVVLPLKAVAMNLMSVLASYGSLVIAYKWGWLSFIGIPKAPTLYPVTLPLILTICSGLSMDYHVFLLSRIQERYLVTRNTRTSVGEGLASSATAITSAALIMAIIFLAFVVSGTPSTQQVGFAAAVAIALDATLVRLIIVPSAMELLGDWNWWLPAPIERIMGSRFPIQGAFAEIEPELVGAALRDGATLNGVASNGSSANGAVHEEPATHEHDEELAPEPVASDAEPVTADTPQPLSPPLDDPLIPLRASVDAVTIALPKLDIALPEIKSASDPASTTTPKLDPGLAIKISGLTKDYGEGDGRVQALKGIDLEIQRGEFVAVMGPSGSGKSTLMHILGALEPPQDGTVEIEGVSYSGLGDKAQTELRLDRIGFAFQFFNLIKTLSAEENVMLPSMIAGGRPDALRARARELLDLVGLSARYEHLPSQMSGGEQQRVSIARSLMRSPGLLLADEPTGNLDSKNSAAVLDLLSRLQRDSQQTIVMVTHDAVAASRATRVVFLRDGLIAGEISGGDSNRIVEYFVSLEDRVLD